MQAFNPGPAPTENGVVDEWQTLTGVQLLLWTQVWLCPWHTVSRRLKSTVSLTAFLPRPDSYFSQHCLFIYFFPVLQNWDILYKADYVFFFTGSTIFCLSVMYSSHHNIFLVFFLCLVLAVVLPSLLSTMTTLLPVGQHLPFIQHFFSFPFAHPLAHAAAQLCQTHVVRPKRP